MLESGIPLRGFGGPQSSNCFAVIVNTSWQKKKRELGECSDSTDSVSKDDPDPVQTVARCSLGNPPETPVTQVLSLLSSRVPDHELPIPEHDQRVQDCFPLASSKADEAASINKLGLLGKGAPQDNFTSK